MNFAITQFNSSTEPGYSHATNLNVQVLNILPSMCNKPPYTIQLLFASWTPKKDSFLMIMKFHTYRTSQTSPPAFKVGYICTPLGSWHSARFPGATPTDQSPLLHISSDPALPSVSTRNRTFFHEGFRKSFLSSPTPTPPPPIKVTCYVILYWQTIWGVGKVTILHMCMTMLISLLMRFLIPWTKELSYSLASIIYFLKHYKYTVNMHWITKETIWCILRQKEKNPGHSEKS